MFVAWWRRRRYGTSAIAIYTVIALALMAPLAPTALPFTGAQDLCNHLSGVIEARNALAEGQFPIRVAPHQLDQSRYPIFQFYGNLPYTLGGAAYLATDISPYRVLRVEITAFLVLGGFFMYRCARRLTRQPLAAIATGAVFMTAPYVLTDLHGRIAFAELVSFMLLPAVFYYSWRTFVSRRLGAILAGGVAWSALALSHNVTFLFAAAYFGLFYLSWLNLRRKRVIRCVRVGVGFTLGVVLTLWSIVPQQQLVPYLCGGLLGRVWNMSWLTPLGVLLAPSVALPTHVPTMAISSPEHFGLQVGWPILAAVGVCICYLRSPQVRGRQAVLGRFLCLFGLAFIMTWTPFDFWNLLPSVFSYVQFSYRVLMFVVLWGSLLAAYALALAWQDGMKPIHLAAVILALGWSASPYLLPHRADPGLSIEKEIANPDMGRGGATSIYHISATRLVQSTLSHPDLDWAASGVLDWMEFNRHGAARAVYSNVHAGDVLIVEGTVMPEAQPFLPLTITLDMIVLAKPELAPGPFKLTIPVPPGMDKERGEFRVHGANVFATPTDPNVKPPKVRSYELARFALKSSGGKSRPVMLMSADKVRPLTRFGHPTVAQVDFTESALVQLPVFFYPGVQEVRVNGRQVETQHLARLVAVELPPGQHAISVRFIGVKWANIVSAVAWAWVILTSFILGWRSLFKRSRPNSRKRLFHVLFTRKTLDRLLWMRRRQQPKVTA